MFSRVIAMAVPGGGFADLENRQRRKSLVGSNPTPSAFLEWLLFSGWDRAIPQAAWSHFEWLMSALDRLVAVLVAPLTKRPRANGG